MSLANIQAAIDAQLVASSIPTSNIAFQNTPYIPLSDTSYYETQMVTIGMQAVGNGPNGLVQWTGTYMVKCRAPISAGVQPLAAMVDLVMSIYPKALTLITTDGLEIIFDQPSPKAYMIDDRWIACPVMMPWFAYEVL